MEARHIQIGYRDAIESKKDILNSQLSLLHSLKRLRSYNIFRKRELRFKNEIKSKLNVLKAEINSVIVSLPEAHELEEKRKLKKITKINIKEPKETREIQKELDEIKKKLEKLGG